MFKTTYVNNLQTREISYKGKSNELCDCIRKGFPSIVREFLLQQGISFYSNICYSIVREGFPSIFDTVLTYAMLGSLTNDMVGYVKCIVRHVILLRDVMLTVCQAMIRYIMLTCYMYYRVPFYTRTTFKQKQKSRISNPRPNREYIFLSFRLGNNVFRFCLLFMCFSKLFMCLCVYMCFCRL